MMFWGYVSSISDSLWFYWVFLIFLTISRLFELKIANQNHKSLLASGAKEFFPNHYRFMVLLHSFWLLSCFMESTRNIPPPTWISVIAIIAFIFGFSLRMMAIRTLKKRWSTRIFVLPGEKPIQKGIYRYLRHPNYLGVILEIAAVPLIYGSYITAFCFSLANGLVLWVRIRAEETALEHANQYSNYFEKKGRFFPNLGDVK